MELARRSILIGIATITCLVMSFVVMHNSAHAQFNTLDSSCEAATANGVPRPEVCDEGPSNVNPITGDDGALTKAANIIAIITAVAATIVIIVAGMTMTLSSGDSSKIRSSRDAIIYASIGLVVVGLARTIVVFLIGTV